MRADSNHHTPLAVTIGEPAGVGADIILKVWKEMAQDVCKVPPFFLICDPQHLRSRARLLGIETELELIDTKTDWRNRDSSIGLPLWPLKNTLHGLPSNPNKRDAAGIVEAITTAVDLVKLGTARGLVTLPINKKSLYDSGFNYPGHTEFLGTLAAKWPGNTKPVQPVMMLAGPELRAVPVTIHIPLKDVPDALTSEKIIETVTITEHDLRIRFGIPKPRVAISGLNPHAGEEGTMGKEDAAIVAPAVQALQDSGINCFGPLPADTMFHPAAREKYDVAICMYHDQALIPAKALAFDETVNVTLGLPFVRTSPDHGTAYDIAGSGKASPTSTLAAMQMADEMTRS